MFIELTLANGDSLLINTSRITAIIPAIDTDESYNAKIRFSGDSDLYVRETYDEIKSMLPLGFNDLVLDSDYQDPKHTMQRLFEEADAGMSFNTKEDYE